MNEQTERQDLIDQYQAYAEILVRAGLFSHIQSEEELANRPLNELRQVVHRMRDIARTPRE